jgi:hypothetical protein
MTAANIPPITIAIDGSTGWFGPIVINEYGAPKLSELNACGAPALEEPPNYIATFVLNSIFMRKHADPTGRLILMFGRRVLSAMHEYTRARDLLLAYVHKLHQTNSHFLQAMIATTHFEQCIASACQATAFFQRLVDLAGRPKVDDDRVERLRRIFNRSKHFDEDLVDVTIADAEITAPVWLTNYGISSANASVTFEELHSLLTDLLKIFKSLSE